MKEEKKEETKTEAKAEAKLAQYPTYPGGPPEDSITPPVCSYHKSEDGSSCDKVITPCQESGEVPPLKGCPARSIDSSRRADAPPSAKKEAEMKEEKKEEAKTEAKAEAKLAQYPTVPGGPPEDSITPPVCSYQKSEDGSSCDKVVVPCQESGEVPPLKGCPKRSIDSSRNAEAPKAVKPVVEAPVAEAPVAEAAKLAQTSDDKKVTKKE
jgi:hypothetical protein